MCELLLSLLVMPIRCSEVFLCTCVVLYFMEKSIFGRLCVTLFVPAELYYIVWWFMHLQFTIKCGQVGKNTARQKSNSPILCFCTVVCSNSHRWWRFCCCIYFLARAIRSKCSHNCSLVLERSSHDYLIELDSDYLQGWTK